MKITPQDIIDKEFRVKFRGFDMVEVDTFLEEVAEIFFKLNEENTRLNEKVLTLQENIDSGDMIAPQGQMELPAELGNFLEELKQDTAAISAELVSLKQDRSLFVSLEKNIKEAVASLQKATSIIPTQSQTELPADLSSIMEEFKKGSEAINAELVALKEDRHALDSLKKSLGEVISSAKEAGPAMTPQIQAESGNLAKTLDEFRQGTETMGAELASLKEEVGSIQQIREEIKGELKELFKSYFDDLDAKLSQATPAAISADPKPEAATAGVKKKPLPAAIIKEKPDDLPEDTGLPDFAEQDETFDDDLEFLTEDDLLDVDKLRGIFQSALDGSTSDTPNSREDDDGLSADLLFLEDDIMDDEHEPKVTFSLDEENVDKKSNKPGKTR
ncbi:MAG: DivIVA domain-containing protein [Desulfobacterales bacterium]|nr:DivIVA domain-containing protein [Desulfobacterales bacterium]